MYLVNALRLTSAPCLACVGSGGKSTALLRMAYELKQIKNESIRPVFVTSTTHFSVEQKGWADAHFVINEPQDIFDMQDRIIPGVLLFCGDEVGNNRVSGLSDDSLVELKALADTFPGYGRIPLLIEADGSRRLPLKAPADHEPNIPKFVETVVVVAGLSGLGKRLTAEWVHRPDQFSKLSGLDIGAEISVDGLTKVLTHPIGGLKHIPVGAKKSVLLNQADATQNQGNVDVIAKGLLEKYSSVVVSSLSPGTKDVREKKIRVPNKGEIVSCYEKVVGIILAAGESKRLGKTKQLLPWRGQSLIRHVACNALDAGLSDVVVVTGNNVSKIEGVLQDLELTFIYNAEWRKGQSTSVKAGLRALPPDIGAVIFILADQPRVSAKLMQVLVGEHRKSMNSVVAPVVDGQRVNPVLFDRRTFSDLFELEGDTGGREVISKTEKDRIALIPWEDKNIFLDVDTHDDYLELLVLDEKY